jgi:hypothetical protein
LPRGLRGRTLRDMRSALFAIISLSSRIAAAQPEPAAPPAGPASSTAPAMAAPGEPPATAAADPRQLPGFVVIDRFDARTRTGLDVSYLAPDSKTFGNDTPTLLRFSAQLRYVDKPSGVGGYVMVPFSYANDKNGNGGSDTITDVGDVELGAIYVPRLASANTAFVLHAGVTLPTGETGAESLVGLIESSVALPQLYNSIPKGITGKVGFSPMFRSGNVFARIDLGLDWNFDAKDATIGKGIHYNAGVGVELGQLALMFESENLSLLDEGPPTPSASSRSGTTLNAIAVSGRFHGGSLSPYLAVIVPVEEDTADLIDLAVTVGIDFER